MFTSSRSPVPLSQRRLRRPDSRLMRNVSRLEWLLDDDGSRSDDELRVPARRFHVKHSRLAHPWGSHQTPNQHHWTGTNVPDGQQSPLVEPDLPRKLASRGHRWRSAESLSLGRRRRHQSVARAESVFIDECGPFCTTACGANLLASDPTGPPCLDESCALQAPWSGMPAFHVHEELARIRNG